MLENLTAGLISGLVVTMLVVVFSALWRVVLVPWFEDRVYKDVRIEGSWYSVYPGVIGARPEVISIERHGHSIKGSIICTDGADTGEKYKIHGSFRNLILTLTYESDCISKIDRGTITLRCMKNGTLLTGKIANYHDPSDSIESTPVIWFNSKEAQEKARSEIRLNHQKVQELRKKDAESRNKQRELTEQVVNADAGKVLADDQAGPTPQPAENATEETGQQ